MTSGLQRAWVTSPALPSAELHFGSARHHTNGTAVIGGGIMVLDIFKILGLPLHSHGLFSGIQTWCQASTSLHDHFNPGIFTAIESASSPMAIPGFLWCQASDALPS